MTSSSNEKESLNNNTNTNDKTIIDLKGCETLLRQVYNINSRLPFIFIKYEKITDLASGKNIQYEVYNPINYNKLNLSMCIVKNLKLEMTIPIKLDEETKKLYNSLKEEDYDLFDLDNDFYTDICATYTAENKADILLEDRLYYFYRKIANIDSCPKDCKYSKYYIQTNNLL